MTLKQPVFGPKYLRPQIMQCAGLNIGIND